MNPATSQIAQQLLQEQKLKEAQEAWARIHNRAHRLFTCLKNGNGKAPQNLEMMSLCVVAAQLTFGSLGNKQIDLAITILANNLITFEIEEQQRLNPVVHNQSPLLLDARGRPIPTHNNEDHLSENALLSQQKE